MWIEGINLIGWRPEVVYGMIKRNHVKGELQMMKSTIKQNLKAKLVQCRELLRNRRWPQQSPYEMWKRTGDRRWTAEVVGRPEILDILLVNSELNGAAKSFMEDFFEAFPKFNGMVGYDRFGRFNLGVDRHYLFRRIIDDLWAKHGSFDFDDASIDTLLNELESFCESSTTVFKFIIPLLNFHCSDARIGLPDELQIRRLTEREVSETHRYPSAALGTHYVTSGGINEFCIEGEFEESICFGDRQEGDEYPAVEPIWERVNKAILALRTFKDGPIGYKWIVYSSVGFCPIPLMSHAPGDLHVPLGSYVLRSDEIEPLKDHAKNIFSVDEPIMEMACSRLADAQSRSNPRDKVVDAVIGMESLLLAAHENHGELSFRFCLNYAMLFPPQEREEAFMKAKGLYDLRSSIAHGGKTRKTMRDVSEGANVATAALRKIILHFLPMKDHPYLKPYFWRMAYFGVHPAQ